MSTIGASTIRASGTTSCKIRLYAGHLTGMQALRTLRTRSISARTSKVSGAPFIDRSGTSSPLESVAQWVSK